MPALITPLLSENVPSKGNAVTRWVGRFMLALMGWRIEGTPPNVKKLVICAAPHTSNWDFIVAMFMVMALGLHFSFVMKKEAFFWPFTHLFLWLGGLPLDRKNPSSDVVDQATVWYEKNEKLWLAIAPEGTRSRVERWKTGFLRIAYQANVPILLVAWHYPDKALYLDKLYFASGNHTQDALEIREYMNSKYVGRHPEKQ